MESSKMPIVAAFKTWPGGKSCFYCVSEDGEIAVEAFIDNHYDCHTFAELHTFTDEGEARKAYYREGYIPVIEIKKPYVVYLNKTYNLSARDAHLWAEKKGIEPKEFISETAFWSYLDDGHLDNVPVYFCKDKIDNK